MKIAVLLFLAAASFAQSLPTSNAAEALPLAGKLQEAGPEQVLLKADRDFYQATAARRLEGWMEYMADDAVLFSGKPVVGKAAIRAFHAAGIADPEFRLIWQPTRAEMFPSGDMGYTVGRYELHARNPRGERVVRHGSYLTVWKKQADGGWKVAVDGGSADKAAVGP